MGEAAILFLPDESNPDGLPGQDQTGPEGNYKVMTGGQSGFVPGKYKVVITKSLVDASQMPEAFKDDPYMAKLSIEGPAPASKTSKNKQCEPPPTEIKGEFEAEVPEAGAVLDFDVKSTAAAAKKA